MIIDYLFSKVPASTWLINTNQTSHRMISVDVKRKLKASTRIICCTIPHDPFENSHKEHIEEGKTLSQYVEEVK